MISKFLKIYDSLVEFLIVVFFMVMIVILFGEVIARFFFNLPMMWSEEVGRYLFIWIVYLGSAKAFIDNRHLIVDVFSNKIPPPYSRYLDFLLHIIIIVFLFFVFVNGAKYSAMYFNKPAYSMEWIRIGWTYAAVPVGALFMILNIIRILPNKINNKS